MSIVRLDGETLTVANVVDIARNGAKVEIDAKCRDEIVRVRRYIDDHWLVEGAPPTYGFNTGVGKLKDYAISQEDNDRFQLNIVLSHCAGLGVQVWTVDTEDDARRLLEWGVDALITDRPDRLVPLVRSQNITRSVS